MESILPPIIEKAGGAAAIGRALGITSQAVSQWKRCPAERVLKLAELAGVPPHEIRPDLYPAPDRAA